MYFHIKMINYFLKIFSRFRTTILYGIIGVSAVVVDLSVFFVLYNYFAIYPVISTILSVAFATFFSFFTNVYFNFRTKDYIKRRMISFLFVSGLGMFLSAVVIYIFSGETVSANVVKALSLPPIVILQYILNSRITFKKTTLKEEDKKEEHILDNGWRKNKKVAVIGGGFTGLTATYELSKKGYKVTLFEAESVVGGLVAGFDLDGIPLERAYHFLYKTDAEIINLAEEIGVGDKLHFYPSSLSLFYEGKLYPFMTPGDLLRFTPLTLSQRIRAGVVALYLSWEKRWHSFAQVTAIDWLRKWCGKRATEVIWEPILRGKFFNFYDSIAMSYVWSRVFVRANSKDRGDVTEKLGYFDGGFQTFTNRLAEKAKEKGAKIVCNCQIESIIRKDNGVIVTTKNNGKFYFDAVLSTTPSNVFSKMIEDDSSVTSDYLDKLNSVDYLGSVLMVFATDKKFTDYYWHNINDDKHPFLVLLSLSALTGAEKFGNKHIYYIGAYLPHDHRYFGESDEKIKTEWIRGVKDIFPDFDESTITDSHIFKFKNAQHIVDVNYQRKILPYKTPVQGVFLSNFSQIFPDDRGTNYAVKEGVKVADILDEDISKRDLEDIHPDSGKKKRLEEPDLSIILPTFNESKNIAPLLRRIIEVFKSDNKSYECIFVDDSKDETARVIIEEAKKYSNVYLIKREGDEARSGLTQAFFKGFQSARGKKVVCMDTDLQHPPEKIPELIESMEKTQADIVVASRYTDGGSSSGLSDVYRKFVSKFTTRFVWFLLPSTRLTTDPMTGFFALKKDLIDDVNLSSSGFKILTEMLVMKKGLKVVDIPFEFGKRIHNDSKTSLMQGVRFFKDVSKMFVRESTGSEFIKHILVLPVFFLFYVILTLIGLPNHIYQILGIEGFGADFLSLFLISLLLSPLVMVFLFPQMSRLVSFYNTGLTFLWIFLNSWIFFVFNEINKESGVVGILLDGAVFTFLGLIVLVVLRPVWRKNKKVVSSGLYWFLLLVSFGIVLIISDFLVLNSFWYYVLFLGYIIMVIQGIFALYLTIYFWDRNNSTPLENSFSFPASPRYSFTAIIPCKHEKSVIADTLKAISRMDYPEDLKQVIVVIHQDSDDGTINVASEAIKKIGKNNIQLVTYNIPPVNKPHGLNHALNKATGDYVVIFDAEDEPHPGVFQFINSVLVKEKYDVLQSGVQLMNYGDGWYSLFNVLEYYFWFKSTLHFFVKQGVVPLGGVTVFFRRKILEEVGGWDNNCLTEDAEVGFRISQTRAKIGIVYDPFYVTKEQTPLTLWSFIKQRTRWAQGFLQILSRGEWKKMPNFKSKFLAFYVLAWPLILPPIASFFLLGLFLAFFSKVPPMLALIANIPFLVFIAFIIVQFLGFHEFCKEYKVHFSWFKIPIIVFAFFPFTAVLAFSGFRALYRNYFRMTSWEKTEHLNERRVQQSQDLSVETVLY